MVLRIQALFCLGVFSMVCATSCDKTNVLFERIKSGDLTYQYIQKLSLEDLNCIVDGQTPLMCAIKSGKLTTADLLVSAGVDVNKPVGERTPLDIAITEAPIAIIRLLLSHGAHLSDYACVHINDRRSVSKFFMDTFKHCTLGSLYEEHNRFSLTRAEVDHCLDIMLASTKSEWETTRLIKLGAPARAVGLDGVSALQNAEHTHKARVAHLLRVHGAAPSDTFDQTFFDHIKNNTLTFAFMNHYFTGIDRRMINRSFKELGGLDVLSYAIKCGSYDAVDLLTRYGASNLRNALRCALTMSPKKYIALLLERGALLYNVPRYLELIIEHNPDAPVIIDWLAPTLARVQRTELLFFACLHAKISVADVLLKHGARINYKSHHGNKAYYNAILSRNQKVIDWVVAHGADKKLTPEQRTFVRSYSPSAFVEAD